MTVPDEVDIIVCGGGSCGCVVAGRLVLLSYFQRKILMYQIGQLGPQSPGTLD
jgi:alcohol oxidase